MINSGKIFKLTENQQSFLVYVNPWWDKQLVKLIKQERRWLRKFGQPVNDYFPQTNYDYDQYPQLIKNVNYFLNFYEAKTKAILKLPRAVAKFRKWYRQTEQLKALLTGIISITQFYEITNSTEIANKRQYLIDETNGFLKTIFHNYQESIASIAPQETHETLNQIYKNITEKPDTFFNPILVFNLIRSYLNRLVKVKKINDEVFVNLLFKTVSTAIFFEAYINFQNQLLKNVI